jgi:ankyrin repeat protein
MEVIMYRLIAGCHEVCDEVAAITMTNNGDGLIHIAARAGLAGVLSKLLSLGINVDSANDVGETALFQGSRAGHCDVVKLLLHQGANTTLAAHNGETVLHWLAAFPGEQIDQVATLLMEHGASACLYSAVQAGHSSAMLSYSLFGTPLHYAVGLRNVPAVQALLSKGANPWDHDSGTYDTPFQCAIRKVSPAIVQLMLTTSLSDGQFRRYQNTRMIPALPELLQAAITTQWGWDSFGESYSSDLIEIIDLLRPFENADNVALVSATFGLPLLHVSIAYGLPAGVTEHLLRTGCYKHLELMSDFMGLTPLNIAIFLNRQKTFSVLLNHGADTNGPLLLPSIWMSSLMHCASAGAHGEYFARQLIDRGAKRKRIHDMELSWTHNLPDVPPAVMALLSGNFDLAKYFTLLEYPDGRIPPDVPLLFCAVCFSSRMPRSRLRHLLEPPSGVHAVELDDNKKENRNCFHALSLARGGAELESVANFRYLLQHSRSRRQDQQLLNQMDCRGCTPLTLAALLGRLELVREMLHAGADPNLGAMTCPNAALIGLRRLRKAPFLSPNPHDSVPLSRREARWLEEDFQSIILIGTQFGGKQPTMLGSTPKIDYSLLLGSNFKVGESYGGQVTLYMYIWLYLADSG